MPCLEASIGNLARLLPFSLPLPFGKPKHQGPDDNLLRLITSEINTLRQQEESEDEERGITTMKHCFENPVE